MKTIYIVGLGPGDPLALTLRALQILKRSDRVYVRSEKHSSPAILKQKKIKFRSLDRFDSENHNVAAANRKTAGYLLAQTQKTGEVVYAVPGYSLMRDKTAELILKWSKAAGVTCRTLPSVSLADEVRGDLRLAAAGNLAVLDAKDADRLSGRPDKHLLVICAGCGEAASLIKSKLSLYYPGRHPVTVIGAAAAGKGKRIATVPLSRLDSLPLAFRPAVYYLPPLVRYGMEDLLMVMRRLRGKDGCPWDAGQDHFSLRPYLLEEAYEVIGAIDSGDKAGLCEELGDLLLQVVFHGQVAAENGDFTFYHLTGQITEKLIRRHPHVFGAAKAETADEVLRNWQQIKKSEKKLKNSLFSLELYLPALLRAQKLQRQAAGAGFDWPDAAGAWDKVEEELKELKDAYILRDEVKIKEEMGDLLFSLVNVARFLNLDAEQALAASTGKFYNRLLYVEKKAREQGGEISDNTLMKLDEWWEEAKKLGNG